MYHCWYYYPLPDVRHWLRQLKIYDSFNNPRFKKAAILLKNRQNIINIRTCFIQEQERNNSSYILLCAVAFLVLFVFIIVCHPRLDRNKICAGRLNDAAEVFGGKE